MKAILCVAVVLAMFMCGISVLVGPDPGSLSRTPTTTTTVGGNDKVKGLGSNWVLVQQSDRHMEVLSEIERLGAQRR